MSEWNTIFSKAFDFVKKEISQYHSKQNVDEMTPEERALVTGIRKLPLPIKIIDVQVDNQTFPHLKDKISQFVLYDVSNLGQNQVTYCGTIAGIESEITNALITHFGISNSDASQIASGLTTNFEYTGFGLDDYSYLQFTRYNIRENVDQFLIDMRSLFYSSLNDYIVKKFIIKKDIDFNKIYQLKNDPILSHDEFLKPDSRSEHLTLEYLQSIISGIQLIPEVPQPVKVEFQRAKDLFIFSYFKYEFSTLSDRSALFALEVAMRYRYLQSLKGKAIITYENQTVHELIDPTYSQISDFLYEMRKRKNWNSKYVKVNGEKFPFSVTELIEWLGKNGIPKWKLRLYHAGRKMRNSLAHPEHASIYPQSNGMLLRIAYDINELFASTKE